MHHTKTQRRKGCLVFYDRKLGDKVLILESQDFEVSVKKKEMNFHVTCRQEWALRLQAQ